MVDIVHDSSVCQNDDHRTGGQNGVKNRPPPRGTHSACPGGAPFWEAVLAPPWGTLLESALGHNMMCPWTRLDMAGHPMTVTRTKNDNMNRALALHQERRHRYAIHNIRHLQDNSSLQNRTNICIGDLTASIEDSLLPLLSCPGPFS